jgi:hypothetical protein
MPALARRLDRDPLVRQIRRQHPLLGQPPEGLVHGDEQGVEGIHRIIQGKKKIRGG